MKTPVLGLTIAALAFVASTIYLSVQLHEERVQADKLAEVTRGLNARIAELEKARVEPRFAITGGTFGSATGSGGSRMIAPPAPVAQNDGGPDVAQSVIINAPPPSEAFVKMMRSQIRANNKRLYADVGAALGITKDEANELIDLLTDQESMGFREAGRDAKAEIADLLGAGKAQSLEEYQQTIPARQELEIISRQLEGVDAGLTEDQHKRLLAVLVEEHKRLPRPNGSDTSTPETFAKAFADWQREYGERVASEARQILTSEQLSTYNAYQQWQREMREQMATMRPVRGTSAGTVTYTTAAPVAISADAVMLLPSEPVEEKPRKEK